MSGLRKKKSPVTSTAFLCCQKTTGPNSRDSSLARDWSCQRSEGWTQTKLKWIYHLGFSNILSGREGNFKLALKHLMPTGITLCMCVCSLWQGFIHLRVLRCLSDLLRGFALTQNELRFKGKHVSLHYYSDAIVLLFRIISVQNNIVKYSTGTCVSAKITFREE